MRPRGFLIVAAVVLAVCVGLAAFVLPSWIGPRVILTDGGNGYGQSRWHMHRPFSLHSPNATTQCDAQSTCRRVLRKPTQKSDRCQ